MPKLFHKQTYFVLCFADQIAKKILTTFLLVLETVNFIRMNAKRK